MKYYSIGQLVTCFFGQEGYEFGGHDGSATDSDKDNDDGNDCISCFGGAAVLRRTRDRNVAGSTPGLGAIKSTRSTQPSIRPG